jgi:predicted DNA-binding transcriptional regulator AlpA
MVDNEGLVDLDWLSEFLDIPERTIYAWRQRGEGPPAYRGGRYLRYRRSEVEAWLNERHDNDDERVGSRR